MTLEVESPLPDDTGSKQAATRFKPGQSGDPNGRPRGARNRLAGDLLEALADDFSQHGVAAIQKVRETDAPCSAVYPLQQIETSRLSPL